MDQLALFLQMAVQTGTPIMLGTLGGILNEKVGHTNLGVEGMMLMGAVMGFMTGINTGNPVFAVLAAGLAGAVCALLYAVITVTFMGNQVVTGLVLTIFGTGLSSFLGDMETVIETGERFPYTQVQLDASVTKPLAIFEMPGLCEIPILGKMLFTQSIYVYISIAIAVIIAVYLKKTRPGLNMRMIGENPAAADASGINVTLYKYLHICAGGFLCGMGGAYLSLVNTPGWKSGMTAGLGWIAVALVIFATWDPIKALFGAYFFGAMRALGPKLQNVKLPIVGEINSQFLNMLPYIMTIIMLIFITLRKKKEYQPPAALSTSYFREDR